MFFTAEAILSGEMADKTKKSEARSTSSPGMVSLNLSAVKSHTNAQHLSVEYDEWPCTQHVGVCVYACMYMCMYTTVY